MKKRYYISSLGYMPPFPSFSTLKEARAVLRQNAREDLNACKRRFGAAAVSWFEDSYQVKIGNKQSVSIWSSCSIVAG